MNSTGNAMLLAAADKIGVRNVRLWHESCPHAATVIADAASRRHFGFGVAVICDAVQEFSDSRDCDAEANSLAECVARFAAIGGRWTPGNLCDATRWKHADKVELLRLIRHAAAHLAATAPN